MVYNFMSIRTCWNLSKSSKQLVNIYWGPTCIAFSAKNIMVRKKNILPSWNLHPSKRETDKKEEKKRQTNYKQMNY